MKKLGYTLAGVLGTLTPVALTFADTFSTSTAPTTVTNMIADVALIIGTVIGTILGLYAALVGLGWGVRKFKHYVSGRKF